MPRVFNSIKRHLLKDSNFIKYLLYAIGEIVLIVLGILIAVQLNNNNELRNNRMKVQTFLLSLSKDFQTNISILDSSILAYDNYMSKLETSMNYIGLQSHEISQEMKVNIIYNAKHIHTSLVEGTLNSVLTSDKLELFGNEYLINLLTAYPAHVDGFYDTQNKAEFIVMNRHRPVLEQFLSLADVFPEENERFHVLKNKGEQSDFTGLLKSLKYQNVLIDRFNMESDLIESAKLLRLRTYEILEIMIKELAVIQEV